MLEDKHKKIYSFICENHMTKKDLTRKTNLPSSEIDKILKELSGFHLIKKIKKPELKGLNLWVLIDEA